jgi:hypothetical protein
MNSFDDDLPPWSFAPSLVFVIMGLLAVVVLIALFVAPSASATGGCGGG